MALSTNSVSICVVSGLSISNQSRRVIKFGGFIHLDMAICYLNEIDSCGTVLTELWPLVILSRSYCLNQLKKHHQILLSLHILGGWCVVCKSWVIDKNTYPFQIF